MTQRTDERAEFLASIITGAVEGGIGYWSVVEKYKWQFLAMGGEKNDATVTIGVLPERDNEPITEHFTIGLDDIARALGVINAGPVKGICEEIRKRYVKADRDYKDADLDSDDYDAIFQIACFGEVIYG